MPRLIRSTTRVKPLRQIMCTGDKTMMTQFIRLAVLYEDLRIEVAGMSSDHAMPSLEEIDSTYRKLYFLWTRRSESRPIAARKVDHLRT